MKSACNIPLLLLTLSLASSSCRKAIEIPPPVGTITSTQVFSSDGEATSAVVGMYYRMINISQNYSSGATTFVGGMSSDELIPFDQTSVSQESVQFWNNNLSPTNSIVTDHFWRNMYSTIYAANAVIEGLEHSSGVHDSVRRELTGEAKFLRAFCDFYLVNLFGDIPLVTTTNWHNTNLLVRSHAADVYKAILDDLKSAQSLLAADYSVGRGQRIIPNKWATTALLARAYLYRSDWDHADSAATSLINNSLFTLADDPNKVFLTNSTEAIWQLQQNADGATHFFNATPEGYLLIPMDSSVPPYVFLTNQLLTAFEDKDRRKTSWIDTVTYLGKTYCIPYKYKMGPAQATLKGPYVEYYMVLRLAEQFLIRAEARIQKNDLSGAIADINIIRARAGLPGITGATGPGLLTALMHERQIELFAEWGHRWLDLKRTGQATAVLQPIKPQWSAKSPLFPIPMGELQTDPNLTQNAGY